MSRMKTAGLVALLMIGLVGCDGGQDIVSPNYEQDMVAMDTFASVGCPTFEETCASIVQQIQDACPAEEFSNYGQLRSCRVHTVNELIDGLVDCYSASQRLAMKKAVLSAVGLGEATTSRTGSKLEYTEH